MNSSNAGDVVLFVTGGTATMQPQDVDRGVRPTEVTDHFVAEVRPYVQNIGLRLIRWGNRPSPHMTPKHMFALAKAVDQVLAEPTVRGAVVIHGTDVLVETAFMAELMLRSTKPVVFTGSMRFYSDTGYDGIRNILNGIRACLLPLPPDLGVVLLMADRMFAARDAIKMNSLHINAFEAPENGPVAYIARDEVVLTHRPRSASCLQRPIIDTTSIEPNVALLTCYTGMDGDLIDHLRHNRIAGLIVEGFGAGNVPLGMIPSLEAMIQANIG